MGGTVQLLESEPLFVFFVFSIYFPVIPNNQNSGPRDRLSLVKFNSSYIFYPYFTDVWHWYIYVVPWVFYSLLWCSFNYYYQQKYVYVGECTTIISIYGFYAHTNIQNIYKTVSIYIYMCIFICIHIYIHTYSSIISHSSHQLILVPFSF